jgi:hypothetical protein
VCAVGIRPKHILQYTAVLLDTKQLCWFRKHMHDEHNQFRFFETFVRQKRNRFIEFPVIRLSSSWVRRHMILAYIGLNHTSKTERKFQKRYCSVREKSRSSTRRLLVWTQLLNWRFVNKLTPQSGQLILFSNFNQQSLWPFRKVCFFSGALKFKSFMHVGPWLQVVRPLYFIVHTLSHKLHRNRHL